MTPLEIHALADAIAERLASRATDDGYVDAHGAAALFACSVPTIERRTKSGEIPSVKVGRLRRYRRADLMALANKKGGGDHGK